MQPPFFAAVDELHLVYMLVVVRIENVTSTGSGQHQSNGSASIITLFLVLRPALFEEAELLVKSAISSAISREADIFSMRRNLGEILRAKGDLEEAVMVLRGVIQEQEEAGIIREHQVRCSFDEHPGTAAIIDQAPESRNSRA